MEATLTVGDAVIRVPQFTDVVVENWNQTLVPVPPVAVHEWSKERMAEYRTSKRRADRWNRWLGRLPFVQRRAVPARMALMFRGNILTTSGFHWSDDAEGFQIIGNTFLGEAGA